MPQIDNRNLASQFINALVASGVPAGELENKIRRDFETYVECIRKYGVIPSSPEKEKITNRIPKGTPAYNLLEDLESLWDRLVDTSGKYESHKKTLGDYVREVKIGEVENKVLGRGLRIEAESFGRLMLKVGLTPTISSNHTFGKAVAVLSRHPDYRELFWYSGDHNRTRPAYRTFNIVKFYDDACEECRSTLRAEKEVASPPEQSSGEQTDTPDANALFDR